MGKYYLIINYKFILIDMSILVSFNRKGYLIDKKSINNILKLNSSL